MSYVESDGVNDPNLLPPVYYLCECPQCGVFHFSAEIPLTPGQPPTSDS